MNLAMTIHRPLTVVRTSEIDAPPLERVHETLIAHARDHEDPLIMAFAGVISGAWSKRGIGALPISGLDSASTNQLLDRCFPGAVAALRIRWDTLTGARHDFNREDETEDLVELLLEHSSDASEEARWAAHAVATACMGENHLWQDMGLPSRKALTVLLARWFPALVAKNGNDMKWKKFFYKQLCERAEIFICKAPSCGICVDYHKCFGPEE